MELNKYIDFVGIFKHLMEGALEIMTEHEHEVHYYRDIVGFYNANGHENFSIVSDECEFTDGEINFVFELSIDDANESTNVNSFISIVIFYDRKLEEFYRIEQEQG